MATKPELTQRKGNVYFTPTHTPESKRIPPNVIGEGFMQAESQENYDLWFGIFREIGEECKDMEGCKKKEENP